MITPVSLSTMQDVISRAIARFPAERARIERAAALVALGKVRRVGDAAYLVRSASDDGLSYAVSPGSCACPDHARRPVTCKHRWAVNLLAIAEERERRLAERLAAYDVVAEAALVAAGVAR